MLEIYGIYLVISTIVTIFAYGVDKVKAKSGGFRIPEKVLLILGLLGGGVGGILGMRLFNHKTRKEHKYFAVINFLGLIIALVVIAILMGII